MADTQRIRLGASIGRQIKVPETRSSTPMSFGVIVIEGVHPEIDGGVFAAKSVAGRAFAVEADIFKDGHDVIRAALKYKKKSEKAWRETPMRPLVNDRWEGTFTPKNNTRYLYTVEAWMDPVFSWLAHVEKKCKAGDPVQSEVLEGLGLLRLVLKSTQPKDSKRFGEMIKRLELSEGEPDEVLAVFNEPLLKRVVSEVPLKQYATSYGKELELVVDRSKAQFSAWYEMFPRSQSKTPKKSGTFRDCIARLPDIKRMGFDVIYLPPIHPIGQTSRKGPNNSLQALPDSPGSCWAIGSRQGGHKALHPDLGTMNDFEAFVAAAADHEIEIAIDFALQCSPDHPYVKEHPDWFFRRPDGTIHYAENPPKKYQDIYPLNFYCSDWRSLWEEMKSIVEFWIGKGIRIFRVDNPHTKPLRFWKWLIDEIQKDHPDVFFLAEAFTRPKPMKFLAKAGFAQSYTYFTWRTAKWELRQYLEELTQSDMWHYFRGNFFANTPDILHEYLQRGGRAAFKVRQVLAATLSSNYGIYSGFELCENTPKTLGSEEYLNSEKYEYKVRDWDAPGNIKDFIARVNRIRHENPAFGEYTNLEFYESRNDNILCYGKRTADNSNIMVVVVNLDPYNVQEDLVTLPLWKFGLEEWQTYQMRDLLHDEKYYWKGSTQYVRLVPDAQAAHIFLLKR
ncbi:MAG TPA: alpha-1,4-glucan--maltose-1-phosphate maltosyltransferase [Candidatus Omnitrophota bacterium]|nr:alpha-1,4-glucan--maltose-1-phosphate maltosyltransferase [Candidatus Omnitrophota bacterium]